MHLQCNAVTTRLSPVSKRFYYPRELAHTHLVISAHTPSSHPRQPLRSVSRDFSILDASYRREHANVTFGVCRLSLRIMFLKFHPSHGMSPHSFLWLDNIPLTSCTTLVYPFIRWRALVLFYLLAITNNSGSCRNPVFNPLKHYKRTWHSCSHPTKCEAASYRGFALHFLNDR